MAVGGTAAVDWVRLVRAGVFTGHTAVAVMVSRGRCPVTPIPPPATPTWTPAKVRYQVSSSNIVLALTLRK